MMHTPIVIGLVGFKESGKTYFGKYLEKNYTFKRLSFAQGIKDVSTIFFNVYMSKDGIIHNIKDNESFYNKIKSTPNFLQIFNNVLKYLNINKDINDIEFYILNEIQNILIKYYTVDTDEQRNEHARKLWQYLGTEFGRAVNKNIWINFIDNLIGDNLELLENRIVIDDVRFDNEFNYIKHIKDTHNIKSYLIGIQSDKSAKFKKTIGYKGHSTETDISRLLKLCDYTIINKYNDTFYDSIDTTINNLLLK